MIISPSAISPYKIPTFQSGGEVPFSFGNALEFDGVNDYVSYPSLTPLNSSTQASYSFWLKINDTSKRVEIGTAISGFNGFYILYIHPNLLTQIRNGGATSNTVNITGYNSGWHHFVVVYDGTQAVNDDRIKCYADGIDLSYTSIGGIPTSLSSSVGNNFRLNNLFGQYGDFIIDELAVYNTALSQSQAVSLFNEGNGDYATNYSPANLVGYWRMNGSGTDTTATDETGNYNGTLNNFPASGMWVAH